MNYAIVPPSESQAPAQQSAATADSDPQRSWRNCLFDHLVSPGEDRRRDGEAERLVGLEVDDELKLRWPLDRQR
jgi:hypothetical protein